MRTLALILFSVLFVSVSAQRPEIPDEAVLKKNKIRKFEFIPNDSTHPPTLTILFDKNGHKIYEKYASQPSYTVYRYDKQGRQIELVDRRDDGSFIHRVESTWLPDGSRIDKNYPDANDSTRSDGEGWFSSSTKSYRLTLLERNGTVGEILGNFFDSSGVNTGCYDSISKTRTARERYYFKYEDVRQYDSTGKLTRLIHMTYDTSGNIVTLSDSSADLHTVKRYTVDWTDNAAIYSNGIRLPKDEEWNFYNTYEFLTMWIPALPPEPLEADPFTECDTHQRHYDRAGLLISDTINNTCVLGNVYPYTVYYRYTR